MDEQKAKKVLDVLARMCGYSRCVMPSYTIVCFIENYSDRFTYVYYDKDRLRLLTSRTYADALLKLLRILKNDGDILYAVHKRNAGPASKLKAISKEHIDMLKFELALEGIDVAELFDKKFNA